MYDSDKLEIKLGVTLAEFLASNFFVYIISVTLGAYLIQDFLKTYLFSCLISLICVMPSLILIKHKNPIELIERLFIQKEAYNKLEKRLINLTFLTVLGAWCGALVIPLDWDRWWQEWPVSCVIGALTGSLIGLIFNFVKSENKIKLHL